ncbi:hypothetical protein BRADO3931 [Bradyrhizobium sp. ORS 278]|uniref:hypothetical protein n=1 Tax=Bradyrhizobium sp. (strain ORS 278) TaxID=114615 RepID=UPI0001508C78|nr:hypothetical protein [Bradyrhizobium sp. ORS 278]CAL77689.1 hypothetical protein BRADO3931 [Bradyrhizobium sp. ORS 278]
MELIRFFLKTFLFFFAVILAGWTTIKLDLFPAPPEAWVKVVKDAKETSHDLEGTAKSLERTADGLARTANALLGPLNSSLDLAKAIIGKMPNLPQPPVPTQLPFPNFTPSMPGPGAGGGAGPNLPFPIPTPPGPMPHIQLPPIR